MLIARTGALGDQVGTGVVEFASHPFSVGRPTLVSERLRDAIADFGIVPPVAPAAFHRRPLGRGELLDPGAHVDAGGAFDLGQRRLEIR